jgi:hypothetical protein
MALDPLMLPEPSIWRTYQSPRVSPSIDVFSKVSMPGGKWPQMMTVLVHTLRTRLATTLAVSVVRAEPVATDRAGWTT